ncbi:zinc finger CCCH domain-containing protein 13-like [Zerene cesonia]|uniref:zinc finger CCCH domain-containing protein 13-like n=1 Tax=Zerene cesonia TaxID=33412 RepID=UPI0018E5096C|nr:zinc finger CCCH domain-containing protein 13-like [Zerene cesonia]
MEEVIFLTSFYSYRYGPRNNVGPSAFPPLGAKPVPLMGLNIQPQPEGLPGFRGRFDGPIFDDMPPGVDPPVPGYEPPPFEKPPFGPPGSLDRDRLPPSTYRDPYRPPPYAEGYRDSSLPSIQNDIPLHGGDHPPRYRDNFRPGAPYRDASGPMPYRDGQPYRDQVLPVPHRDANYRNGPPFRDNSFRNAPFRDGNYRENIPHNYRDGGLPFRPPSVDPREQIPPFHDPNYRDGFRDDNSREGRPGFRSNNPRNRVGSKRNANQDHERPREREGRDMAERFDRDRQSRGMEKGRDPRDERGREYDRNRDYDKERGHERGTPERKARSRDIRDKRRSESRGRSRDRDNKKEKKEERVRDKSSTERNKDHKEKDKKVKDRKKKKREKEKELEKKKKRDKKEKKDSKEMKKEEEDGDKDKPIEEAPITNEADIETKEEKQTESDQIHKKEDVTTTDTMKNAMIDLYGDEAAEAVDKEIIQNYIKSENVEDSQNPKETEASNKDEPFDGIELQPAADELGADLEISLNTSKEVLAPLPELSKWEVDEDNQEKSKEPGEITSPEDNGESRKVTSDVIKRAEKAIFAKAVNSLRPIEIKKISSDRLKLYGDETQNKLNNIQITVPVTDVDQRSLETLDKKGRYSKTPPPRLSVKDRLGGKVEDVRRVREPRVVHSTVERVKSRSKTPKREQVPYRRVTVEKDRGRKADNRIDIPKDRHPNIERRVRAEVVKIDAHYRQDIKRKEKSSKEDKNMEDKITGHKMKDSTEPKPINEKERKKSTLDEAHFEPDYDETVESDHDVKDDLGKKREHSKSPGPIDSKKPKFENETIKLDLTNVKKKPDSESESSASGSDDSSSSSSSDARKRKKKKKRAKKKKKRAASDSDSDSGSSSDDHKKKKKKRKHKKKSSKKKKKSKYK